MAGGAAIKNVLTLDVTKFTSAIDQATSDLDSLNAQLRSATSVASSFEKNISGIGSDVSGVANKFKLLDQTVGKLTQKLHDVANGGLSSVSRSSRSASSAVSSLAASSAAAGAAASKAEALTKKYNAELERLKSAAMGAAAAQAKLNAPIRNGGGLDPRHAATFSTGLRHVMMTVAAARFAVLDFYDVFLRLPLAIIKASGEVERMTKLMSGLSRESTDAKRNLEGIKDTKFVFDTAKNAPFEVKAISDAFVKLKVAGLDPSRGSLDTLLNSVAKFGGTAEHLHRASIAIQQMTGKGVISMEELRQQLGEAIPTAMQAMAKGTGLSMSDLVAKISKGSVEATSALERMFAVLRFEDSGASAQMMQTWVGQLEKLKTNWTLFANDVGNSGGFFSEMKNQLELLNEQFDSASARTFAHDISVSLGEWVKHIADGAMFIKDNWSAIRTVGEGLIAIWAGSKIFSAIGATTAAYKSFYATVLGGGKLAIKAEADRVAAINVAAASELAIKRATLNASTAMNAQTIVQNAAIAKRELAQNAAKLVQLEAQEAAHRAAYHAAVAKSSAAHMVQLQSGAYRELATGRITSAATVANNAALATAYFERATAAEISITRIKAAEAGLLATSTGTMAALRANTIAGTAAIAALGNAAIVTAEKATMLKGAVAFLGGPIGIITTLLTAGAFAWWEWGRSAQESADKARDSVRRVKDEMATLEDVQALSDRKRALRESLQNKDAQISVEGKNGIFANKLKAERKAIADELATIDGDIARAREQGEARSIDDSVRGIKSRAERQISAKISAIKAIHNKELGEYDKAFEKGEINKAEKEKKAAASLKSRAEESAKAQVAIWEKTINDIAVAKKKIEDGKDGGSKKGGAKYRGFVSQDNEAREQLAIAKENAKHATKIGTEPDYVGGKDKSGAAKDKKRKDLLEELNATSKKLVAEILSGNTEKAVKILDLLESSGDYSSTPKQRDAIEKKAKEVDALTDYKKAIIGVADEIDSANKKIVGMKADLADGQPAASKFGEAIKQLIEDLPKFKDKMGVEQYKAVSEHLDKMAASAKKTEQELAAIGQQTTAKGLLEKAQSQFNGLQESVMGGSSAIRKMRDDIEKLLKTTQDPEAKAALEKALSFTKGSEDIEDGTHMRDALKVKKDFASKAAQIRADLVGDEKASMRLAYEAEILESNAALELRRQNGEFGIANDSAAYKEALAGLADWQAALTEKLAEASKSPLEKMTDEWKKTYKQLEQLEARWADGFTDTLHDALTTGKADWKGYVLSVANDLSKMMLKDAMADGMKTVMGGIGGFLKGQVSDRSPNAGPGVVDGVLGGLKKLWGSLTGTSKAANSAASAVGESTVKTLASTIGMTSKMSAEVAAVGAIQALAMSAAAAANALGGLGGVGGGAMAGSMGVDIKGMLGGAAGNFSTAASYGTNTFSQQTAMLAAQDSFGEAGGGFFDTISSWFANGGIMTSAGSMPLRAYSNGGIANSPQLAMFGEGRVPEAYVPLPDGRSIPVTMSSSGGQNVSISIVVNKDGGSDSKTSGDDSGAWRKMADRVKGVVREELISQSRPGGILYN
jgi:tape measure domain-containing protein